MNFSPFQKLFSLWFSRPAPSSTCLPLRSIDHPSPLLPLVPSPSFGQVLNWLPTQVPAYLLIQRYQGRYLSACRYKLLFPFPYPYTTTLPPQKPPHCSFTASNFQLSYFASHPLHKLFCLPLLFPSRLSLSFCLASTASLCGPSYRPSNLYLFYQSLFFIQLRGHSTEVPLFQSSFATSPRF